MMLTHVAVHKFDDFLEFANEKMFFKVAVDVLQDTYYFTKNKTPRKEIEEMVRNRSEVIRNLSYDFRPGEDEYRWMGESNWGYRWMEETLIRMEGAFAIEENTSCGFTIRHYKVTKRE